MQTAHILSKDGSFMYRLWIMETFLTTAAMSPVWQVSPFMVNLRKNPFLLKIYNGSVQLKSQ